MGCKSDRSRHELSKDPYSNEYLVAKIGVDTAENEPLRVHLIFELRNLIFPARPRSQTCRPCRRAVRARSSNSFMMKFPLRKLDQQTSSNFDQSKGKFEIGHILLSDCLSAGVRRSFQYHPVFRSRNACCSSRRSWKTVPNLSTPGKNI